MILQRLSELYDRLTDDERYRLAPFGYSSQRIGFRVVIGPNGALHGFEDMRVEIDGRLRPRELVVPGGDKPSGKVTENSAPSKVHLLRNDLPFILGLKVEEGSEGKMLTPSPMEYEAFREKHLTVEAAVADPAFSAVCRFLQTWNPTHGLAHAELLEFASLQGVFQVLGAEEHVHDRSAVRAWWDANRTKWIGEEAADPVACLVTGLTAPAARTHPPVKGVRGGNTTGCSIVGFNEMAFESYGRKQSFNAPVSDRVAFKYVTALNALLDGPERRRHCITLGNQDAPLTIAFWTEQPTLFEDVFAMVLRSGSDALTRAESENDGEAEDAEGDLAADEAQDEGVRKRLEVFLDAVRVGTERCGDLGEDPRRTRFYLLGLAPNAARIAVRFFFTATLAELLENLRRHHRDIAVVRRPPSEKFRGDPEFPPTWLLLDQTCPRAGVKADRKKIPPVLAGPLLTAILTGSRYPEGLYGAVIRRIHADRIVNYPRACIIKGHLNRNFRKEVTMALDPERKDPAYRIGRLFAALEKTQKDALGESLSATIRDRFFGAASATPGAVFPRLLRTYQHHLSKLEGGRKVMRERLVQEILDPLEGFPAHLNLTEQGLFALGYYHQTQNFYTPREQTPADA